jgi:NAD(P)-dependent dehydrogenase (short-subunit alcohol dehydrogenase family)
MRLAGRKILITGAASGIGLATAQMFVREGASVALIDRNAEAVAAVQQRLGALALRADVSDEDDVTAAVKRAGTALGGLDGVVNAAGADLLRPFTQMSVEEWQRILAVNLTGPMLVCRAALEWLSSSGRATIVNIASGAALRPLEHRTAYCAAKAGLVMLTKTLAIDLASSGIRANAICPGIIDTPMFRASFESSPDPDATLAKILERFIVKHPGRPDDIAYAALYLTSDESAHVTGSALAVDGGRAFH